MGAPFDGANRINVIAENNRTSQPDAKAGTETGPHAEPRLHDILEQRKSVLQKNLKTFVYLGAALLAIVAASGKKAPAHWAAMRREGTGLIVRSDRPPTLREKSAKDGAHPLCGCASGRLGHPPGPVHYCKKYPVTLSPESVTIHRISLPADTITETESKVPTAVVRLPDPVQLALVV